MTNEIADCLPEVGSRRIDGTLEGLEHRARLAIGREQAKILPDNALIVVLCDTVRVAREYCDAAEGHAATVERCREVGKGCRDISGDWVRLRKLRQALDPRGGEDSP